jgi:hypothetical protein
VTEIILFYILCVINATGCLNIPLSKTRRVKELYTIINIAENDGYNKQQIIKLYNLEEQKKSDRRYLEEK